MAKPRKHQPEPEPPPAPRSGDRVMLGNSSSIYVVTRADDKDVDLNLEGTNLERFRVPVGDLKFVDLAPRPSAKPAKPTINVEDIRERLAAAQHASVDRLTDDIAILKKYLKSKGIDATEELDRLCEATEKRWVSTVEEIERLME